MRGPAEARKRQACRNRRCRPYGNIIYWGVTAGPWTCSRCQQSLDGRATWRWNWVTLACPHLTSTRPKKGMMHNDIRISEVEGYLPAGQGAQLLGRAGRVIWNTAGASWMIRRWPFDAASW